MREARTDVRAKNSVQPTLAQASRLCRTYHLVSQASRLRHPLFDFKSLPPCPGKSKSDFVFHHPSRRHGGE